MIAEIILNSNAKDLNKCFDYEIPEEMNNKVKIGSLVLIPFGRRKTLEEGYIINIKEKSEYKVKPISSIKEDKFLNEQKIKLAKWISKRYFCNLSDSIKLMLPPGTTNKKIENRIKEKTNQFVCLKKSEEEIQNEIEIGKIKSEKQIRILKFLMENDSITINDLEIYTDTSRAIIKTLEKNGYIELIQKQVERNPFIHKVIKKTEKLNFTQEQQNAYEKIEKSIDDEINKEFLLFGVTGSGKTEIYLQAIEKVFKKGKSSILLVPEISLTPQMVDRFISRFGNETISVLHSKLSIGERFDAWNKIADGKSKIIIGARSAIFAPVKDLGLIIIDEEHDGSYKSEMTPKYDAKEVARIIAKQNSCPLLLGSATPDVNTFFRAEKEELELLILTKRANNSSLPEVKIVDLREELINGNKSMISRQLYEEIEKNIQNKEQTILFLNRRGYSTFIMCRDCGYTVKCKNCDITMTYHLKQNKLKCHYCGYEQEAIKICPSCNSSNIRYFGTGTQKLEQEINKLFPLASTIRMDIDTVSKKKSHEDILNKFKNENIDILIGTQMIVKGHHFPKVTLVGVIAADSSLNIEDYRANERTFQILTQVEGRAGRESLLGRVIVQTYNPDNIAIKQAVDQNYDEFYSTEIEIRKQLKYPPFCDIILIGISGKSEQQVIKKSEEIYRYLKSRLINEKIGILLYKPVPSPIDKIKNKYRWRIIIKCIYTEEINKLLNDSINIEKKENDINVSIEVNPNSMM